MKKTNSFQQNFWSTSFGDDYVNRNSSLQKINEFYEKNIGISVEEIFKTFFDNIDRNCKMLEIGCNIGLKLLILKNLGFSNLCGLDVNKKAIELAKKIYPSMDFINSSIEHYNFKNNQFDLVFTSGVLIHIHPKLLQNIIKKILSISSRYIFGFEYFSEKQVEI